MFGVVGDSVSLQCGDLGNDNVVIWSHKTDVILYHEVEKNNGPQYTHGFSSTKYDYNEADNSLTVNTLDKDDQHCFTCTTTPSLTTTMILVTLLGTEPFLCFLCIYS